MRDVSIISFMLATLLSASAPAKDTDIFESGESLLAACNVQKLSEHWYCVGYVTAAWDTHPLHEQLCPPISDAVTKGHLKRVVVKYLEARPEDLHLTAGSLVRSAFEEEFPCTEP